ncbi:DUF1918 domain-containing protein [Kitasatospora cineracea]|uniref:DUF1918 domain-containing protein n=1 Tax=Kitasatospora cineracea TaxID=88074 RepID=UPI0036C1DC3C
MNTVTAAVGDRIIVEATRPGAARRDGEIVALHHADGSPPYDVRWSDTGRISEYFPGPDARIHHYARPAAPPRPHLFAD